VNICLFVTLSEQEIRAAVKMPHLELMSANYTDENTTNTTLLDFEVFDSRDLMNVLAYAAMSLSEYLIYYSFIGNYEIKIARLRPAVIAI
jgi:hypothetical protein